MIYKFKQIYQNYIYDKFKKQYLNSNEGKYKNYDILYDNKTKFLYAMKLLEHCNNDEEKKLDVINVITDMIINEIKYDYMTCFIYYKQSDLNILSNFFPLSTCDESGLTVKSKLLPKQREVNLDKDRIIPGVWNRKRAIKNILNIKSLSFIFDKNNHWGVYYTYLDICHIHNGNHSTMAGIAHGKQGKMLIDEIDITNLFPYIDTDGENWIHKYNKTYVHPVFDYRLAVIYKMNKIKHEIEHKED